MIKKDIKQVIAVQSFLEELFKNRKDKLINRVYEHMDNKFFRFAVKGRIIDIVGNTARLPLHVVPKEDTSLLSLISEWEVLEQQQKDTRFKIISGLMTLGSVEKLGFVLGIDNGASLTDGEKEETINKINPDDLKLFKRLKLLADMAK